MVDYYELGKHKRLNDIVMAGSHDAAITQGGGNAQTQNMDIYLQAWAGVRIFDIRITGATAGKGFVELKAFHGTDLKTAYVAKEIRPGAGTRDFKVKPMVGGTYGLTLSRILTEAAKFVRDKPNEFLILKFDKCDNWTQIAEACVDILGDSICRLSGSLNTKTLRQLRGKVIVLFSVSGRTAVGWNDAAARGILAFQNLASGGEFNKDFDGLQYFGKGGTSPFNGKSDKKKLQENYKKQAKLMLAGAAAADPQVMGMMYWTTTGLMASIKKRNNFLWSDENKDRLMDLWATRVPNNINLTLHASGAMLKEFMPNFVMIDFADANKCKLIYDLNALTGVRLVQATQEFFAA